MTRRLPRSERSVARDKYYRIAEANRTSGRTSSLILVMVVYASPSLIVHTGMFSCNCSGLLSGLQLVAPARTNAYLWQWPSAQKLAVGCTKQRRGITGLSSTRREHPSLLLPI